MESSILVRDTWYRKRDSTEDEYVMNFPGFWSILAWTKRYHAVSKTTQPLPFCLKAPQTRPWTQSREKETYTTTRCILKYKVQWKVGIQSRWILGAFLLLFSKPGLKILINRTLPRYTVLHSNKTNAGNAHLAGCTASAAWIQFATRRLRLHHTHKKSK